MRPPKKLQDLNLIDKFLFDEVMESLEVHEAMLRIILGDPGITLVGESVTERELRSLPSLKSVRLDVIARSNDNTVYNTEMQQQQRNDLARRSRFYQSLIDSRQLNAGTVNYNGLPDSYVIIIMPYDLFGLGKYVYHIDMTVREAGDMALGDGAHRIFLNTRGRNYDEISSELRDFLHYVEKSNDETAGLSNSERLQKINDRVKAIRESDESEERYLNSWEEKAIIKAEGRAEGIAEGIAEGMAKGKAEFILEILGDAGEVPSGLYEEIISEKDLKALDRWFKIAAKSSSVEEFISLYKLQ